MIIGACVSKTEKAKEGGLGTGQSHTEAILDSGQANDSKLWRGFVSDIDGYKTNFGGRAKTFDGNLRSRAEAWIEAVENKQIAKDNYGTFKISTGDYFVGILDSKMIDFTPAQLAQSRKTADTINSSLSL